MTEQARRKRIPRAEMVGRKFGRLTVAVCERWRSFDLFLADMGTPTKALQIDRINNDGDYEPGNCKWSTDKEQANNRSNNRWLEFDGKRMTVSQWADRIGIPFASLYGRIIRGWSVNDALTKPLTPGKKYERTSD